MRELKQEPFFCHQCGEKLREDPKNKQAWFSPVDGRQLRKKFCVNIHATITWYENMDRTWNT